MKPTIRGWRKADEPVLVSVLTRVFGEYGMRFDPDGYDRDVRGIEERYAAPLGAFFTAEHEGKIVGFAGADLPRPGVGEVHRLYVDPAARGLGLGQLLCERVEKWAREQGAKEMELWSDVRFAHAHLLYAGRGYELMGQRTLTDPDGSVEFGFRRSLSAPLTPAFPGVDSAERAPLARVLAEPGRAHRARMVAAAILDSRSLVRAGRMERGGHELPRPGEVFGSAAATEGVSVLSRGDVIFGFERGPERRVHPLFRGASSSR